MGVDLYLQSRQTAPDRLRFALTLLNETAEQLERWADESVRGGWSTHQVDPMRKKSIALRSEARRLALPWEGG